MKVFVTGATGFVGSHLTQWFESQGHEVWGLCRSREKRAAMGTVGHGVEGSLSTHIDRPNSWIDQLPSDLDAVVHVAGLTQTFRASEFFHVNETGTRRLVDDLRQRHPQLRFTLVSSLAAAGPGRTPTERSEPRPISRYGQSKLRGEQVLVDAAPESWDLAIVRPPMVIGPRDPGMLELFKVVRSRIMLMPGLLGRWKVYSYVGVSDLAELLGRCTVQTLPRRPTFHYAAHPTPVTFLQLMNAIRRTMGIRIAAPLPLPGPAMWATAGLGKLLNQCGLPQWIALTPDKVREASQAGWVCPTQPSIEELGMEYKDDLSSILARTYDDYRERGWI